MKGQSKASSPLWIKKTKWIRSWKYSVRRDAAKRLLTQSDVSWRSSSYLGGKILRPFEIPVRCSFLFSPSRYKVGLNSSHGKEEQFSKFINTFYVKVLLNTSLINRSSKRAYKRVRSSSGQSQNCVWPWKNQDKTTLTRFADRKISGSFSINDRNDNDNAIN